jgi:hypothetical protein
MRNFFLLFFVFYLSLNTVYAGEVYLCVDSLVGRCDHCTGNEVARSPQFSANIFVTICTGDLYMNQKL